MHKATFVQGSIQLTISPAGPILIKAGESGGADPTRPDMEFVRTRRQDREQVYLPGASLKGVVRAQCERICRSLDGPQRYDKALAEAKKQGDEFVPPLADNPVLSQSAYAEYRKGGDDMAFSSGVYFNKLKSNDTALIYRRSSFTSKIFGHTSLASRVRFADAYADPYTDEEPRLEERNGVAIDRVYGSVAVGPFNYETAVSGRFATRIDLENLTLAQLALLGLALRDLAAGRIAIGFGKSRGLGRVTVAFTQLELSYPTCEIRDGELRLLNGRPVAALGELAGLGALCADAGYGLPEPKDDRVPLPEGLSYLPDDFLGVRLVASGDAAVTSVWRACMPAWRREVGL